MHQLQVTPDWRIVSMIGRTGDCDGIATIDTRPIVWYAWSGELISMCGVGLGCAAVGWNMVCIMLRASCPTRGEI